MATVNPYLNFLGNTEEAFNFYRTVFGGDFTTLVRFKDTPEASKMSPEDQNKLMHIALRIGKDNILMATDSLESAGHTIKPGNQIALCLTAESRNEADSIFNKLSAGGKIEMPITDMFWGSYWGMFTDKFGIRWMVDYNAAMAETQHR